MKKYQHRKEKKPTERVSFYIALSVCMLAVGLAVWSAYTAFVEPEDEKESYFSSLNGGQTAVAQDMTGVTVPVSTSAPTAAATAAPTTAPTQPDTKAVMKEHSFTVSETLPPKTEQAMQDGMLSPLQAVLRVSDDLIYPVKSRQVLKAYSEENVYNETLRDYRAHTGCDFSAEEGENVYAMCAGTVKKISVSELYGVIIEQDCGDFSVYYCGLSTDFAVSEGDALSTGDTVGTVGHIPCESKEKPHVHVEIRVGDKLIDPLSVIEDDD